jgi:hypothetical protein
LIQAGVVVLLFSVAIQSANTNFCRCEPVWFWLPIPETFFALLIAGHGYHCRHPVHFLSRVNGTRCFVRIVFPPDPARFLVGLRSAFYLWCRLLHCRTMGYAFYWVFSVISVFVSFCFLLIIGFGLIFELPLSMILLARLGLTKAKILARYRRYGITAAILTPTPDRTWRS